MRSTAEFLSLLSDLGVKLRVDGSTLFCHAPKRILSSALRAELAERKSEILTFLNKLSPMSDPAHEPIPSIGRDRDLALSFGQQRLWILDQLEGGSAAYNMPAALCLKGSVDVAALERAISEIVRRHEVLRTTFPTVKGVPMQEIEPPGNMSVWVEDLRILPEEEQSERMYQFATEEAHRPFDLAKGPLMRVCLMLGSAWNALLVTMHHIVSDGWSMGVFVRELAALYEAFLRGAPSPLPELPIQYADFAHWQRRWLSGEVLENQLNYWRHQLAGAPPLLQLPTDRPRPKLQSFRGGTEYIELDGELTQKLKALSRRSGATLFMTLLTAFVALLSRYSGQEDIVVGSPIANRNRSELESLIGFFVNTLVLRSDLQGNPTFSDLLGRVRRVTLDAYAHQDVPFEQLVEALVPERNLSYSPLFQVMFVLQNAPVERLELQGLTLSPLEVENVTAKFDLTLWMEETQTGMRGALEYNADLFDRATIVRMAGHFQTLLEGIVADPEGRVSDLPLLTAEEENQLLVTWNNTRSDYPHERCVHELFEAQVAGRPDAVAVVFGQERLTYRELNCRSNQLAHRLRSLGVGPEVLVGILMERSFEMVVGLLGVLKAGGAYVPLDPGYPRERLAFMLSDARVSVLLTQKRLRGVLPEHGTRVLCLDSDWRKIAEECEDNPVSGVRPENLAYVIYTSGSTGRPKGVMILPSALTPPSGNFTPLCSQEGGW